jgi:pimeloyl-ACP methyl ester carboxylesterase
MFKRRRQPAPTIFRCEHGKITYETYGDGPPLLLVHGLAGSVQWWRRNIPIFSRHFTVYAVGLAGYGTNRAWRPLRIQAAADCLGALITELPEGHAYVVGHSMGGHIATHLAARHSDRIHRLVLVAASGLLRGNLVRMALKLPVAAWYGQVDFAPTLVRDALRAGPLSLLLGSRDILSDDVTELLASITAPTLLVWGERDVIIPLELGVAAQKAIPNSQLVVIERAGHNVMWDQSQRFNEVVLEYLLHPDEEQHGDVRVEDPSEPYGDV